LVTLADMITAEQGKHMCFLFFFFFSGTCSNLLWKVHQQVQRTEMILPHLLTCLENMLVTSSYRSCVKKDINTFVLFHLIVLQYRRSVFHTLTHAWRYSVHLVKYSVYWSHWLIWLLQNKENTCASFSFLFFFSGTCSNLLRKVYQQVQRTEMILPHLLTCLENMLVTSSYRSCVKKTSTHLYCFTWLCFNIWDQFFILRENPLEVKM
jgi:hypothetical protein